MRVHNAVSIPLLINKGGIDIDTVGSVKSSVFATNSHLAKIALQFLRYLIVGGLAFVIDYLFLNIGLYVGLHYLIATAIGFVAGLITNYSLCVFWVWRGTNARSLRDILVFSLIGLAGLALTFLLMWISVSLLHIDPRIAKIVIAAIVLFWNFGLRRMFVFFH